MKLKHYFPPLIMACVMLGIHPAAANASAILTLNSRLVSTTQGSSITVSGTFTNYGLNKLYINGDQSNVLGSGITLDDSPFLFGSPTSVGAIQSWSGPLFTVIADPDAASGNYGGSFSIVGGEGVTDQNVLATENFLIQVGAAATSLRLYTFALEAIVDPTISFISSSPLTAATVLNSSAAIAPTYFSRLVAQPGEIQIFDVVDNTGRSLGPSITIKPFNAASINYGGLSSQNLIWTNDGTNFGSVQVDELMSTPEPSYAPILWMLAVPYGVWKLRRSRGVRPPNIR